MFVRNLRGWDVNPISRQMEPCRGATMSHAQELIERARMFDERAEKAADPISRQHYREMAAHYRSLSVEHQELTTQPDHELTH